MPSLKTEPTVYPEDIECIVDPVNAKGGIFISNVEAASNHLTLKKHNIKAILTAAFNINLSHSKTDVPLYKKVPGQDHEKFDLSVYFDESVEFIQNALKTTNVLVHCMAGVSRSVSLVLAYFIKSKGMTFQEAYKLVKSRRKIIYPNDGFIQQLKSYQKIHFCSSPTRLESKKLSQSPNKTPSQLSQQLKTVLSKYDSIKMTSITPTKYQTQTKKYETTTSQIYESPSKFSRKYEFDEYSIRKTQYSPLKNYNSKYESPNKRSSMNLAHTLNLSKTVSNGHKYYQNQQEMEMKINNIRKKYSDISKGHETTLHGRTKSYLENQKFMQTQTYQNYRNYDTLKQSSHPSPSKLLSHKLKSYYDRY